MKLIFTDFYDYMYKRRCSELDDRLGNGFSVAWTADVVSIDGANYHFWVPIELKKDKIKRMEFLSECHYQASIHGDRVSSSWSYIPEGG